jgi:hypothetical protein
MELLLLLKASNDVNQMVQIKFTILAGCIRWKASCTSDGVRRLVILIDTAAFTFIDY